jgi:transposase InsO family protein
MRQSFARVPVAKLCELFGVTRQAFYDNSWHDEEEDHKEQVVLQLISFYRKDMPLIGSVKLYILIQPHLKSIGLRVGRDQVLRILRDNGLVIRRRKRKAITTMSRHRFRKYPNIIKELVVDRPDQLWVSDITYLELIDRFCYLALITDVYSHRIVGFSLSLRLDAQNCIAALQMALNHRQNETASLIHHSDRGIQYCSKDYTGLLDKNHIQISMTENGDPYENAIAERINGILKYEFALNQVFESLEDAYSETIKSVSIYNSKRPHASIDYLTPNQAHQTSGELKKRWKNPKRENAFEEIGF